MSADDPFFFVIIVGVMNDLGLLVNDDEAPNATRSWNVFGGQDPTRGRLTKDTATVC